MIDAFADGYLAGATPNPCQACNQYIKFDELLRRGLAAYGADQVATGHYARVEQRDGRYRLRERPTRTRTRPTSCGSSTRDSWRAPASRSVS